MTLTQITEKGIKDGEIVNADINASAAIARSKLANVDLVDDTSPQLGGDLDVNGELINFGDSNDPAVNRARFGASADLQIYHDGGHSTILDNGTGNLKIYSNGAGVDIQKSNGENIALFETDGAVKLYHDNIKQLETFDLGIDIGTSATGNFGIRWGGSNFNYCNIWAEYGSGDLFLAAGLKPKTTNGGFFSSYGGNFERSAIQINAFGGQGIQFFTSAAQTVTKDSAITVQEHFRILPNGDLRISSDDVGTNFGFIDGWKDSAGDMIIGADQSATGTGTSKSNLIFRSRGSERMRMETAGKLHLGYDASSSAGIDRLNIMGGGDGITIARGTANASDGNILGNINFHSYMSGSYHANAEAKIQAIADSGQSGSSAPAHLDFYTKKSGVSPGAAATLHMRLKSSGDLELSDGDLQINNGHGIDFYNFGSGATVDSNKLDDYERGTWTPSFNTTNSNYAGTQHVQDGIYIKVGRLVWIFGRIQRGSVTGGSGAAQISGLPFGSNHGGQYESVVNFGYRTGIGYASLTGWISTSTDRLNLAYNDSNASHAVSIGALSTGTHWLYFSCHYYADA